MFLSVLLKTKSTKTNRFSLMQNKHFILKIPLKNEIGRSWGGDHIYIYKYLHLDIPSPSNSVTFKVSNSELFKKKTWKNHSDLTRPSPAHVRGWYNCIWGYFNLWGGLKSPLTWESIVLLSVVWVIDLSKWSSMPHCTSNRTQNTLWFIYMFQTYILRNV